MYNSKSETIFAQNSIMLSIKKFTFNPFQENTYIIQGNNKECLIIDPGCCNVSENNMLLEYIAQQELAPVMLLNTHCHIDHILGNHLVSKTYQLKLHAHANEKPVLASGNAVSSMYGVPYITSPDIEVFLSEEEEISFSGMNIQVIHAPGHSPGSVCFYFKEEGFLIGGDVLFLNSIGRTDLPLGHHETLINSIKSKLFNLPDETVVHSGHGPQTSIGFEKKTNPYLQ
jgi:glyoxylase-like metal-dependent hydrolase (beta-lactamase superfamily II)